MKVRPSSKPSEGNKASDVSIAKNAPDPGTAEVKRDRGDQSLNLVKTGIENAQDEGLSMSHRDHFGFNLHTEFRLHISIPRQIFPRCFQFTPDCMLLPVWCSDSKCMITGMVDGSIVVHRVSDGTVLRTIQNHLERICALSVFPCGTKVATGSFDKTVRIQSLTTGEQILRINFHKRPVRTVAVSPTSEYVLSGSADKTLKLCEAETGVLVHSLSLNSIVKCCTFSPSLGTIFAVGLYDTTIRLFKTVDAQPLCVLDKFHTDRVCTLSFSSDGKLLSSGSFDSLINIFDVSALTSLESSPSNVVDNTESKQAEGQSKDRQNSNNNKAVTHDNCVPHLRTLNINGGGRVCSVAFSHDDAYLLSGGADQQIHIYQLAEGALVRSVPCHNGRICCVMHSPSGEFLGSIACDNTIKVHRIWKRKKLRRLTHHTGPVRSVSLSDNLIATAGEDGTATLCSLQTGSIQTTMKFDNSVRSIALNKAGSRVGLAEDSRVHIYTIDGRCIVSILGHTGPVRSVNFHPSEEQIVSSSDNSIKVNSSTTGEELMNISSHTGRVTSAKFSRTGTLIVSGAFDDTIKIHNATNGELLQTFSSHNDSVLSVCASVDDKFIVSGGYDNTVRIHDMIKLCETLVIRDHKGPVRSVGLSPSNFIVSGAANGTIMLHTLRGEKVSSFCMHTRQVRSVKFSTDGQYIVSASDDGIIELSIDAFTAPPVMASCFLSGSCRYLKGGGSLLRILNEVDDRKLVQDDPSYFALCLEQFLQFAPRVVQCSQQELDQLVVHPACKRMIAFGMRTPQALARFWMEFVFLWIMLFFVANCTWILQSKDQLDTGDYIMVVTLILLPFYFVVLEYTEIQNRFGTITIRHFLRQFSSIWEFIDLSNILTCQWFGVAALLSPSYRTTLSFRVLGSTTLVLLCARILSTLRKVSLNFAVFVAVIVQIVEDLRIFSLVLLFVMVQFAFVFFLVDTPRVQEDGDPFFENPMGTPFGSVAETMLSMFRMMLGDFEREWYGYSFVTDGKSSFLVFSFVIFMLTVNIVLLNVLIAIVSDSYENAQSRSTSIFLSTQLRFIASNVKVPISPYSLFQHRRWYFSSSLRAHFNGSALCIPLVAVLILFMDLPIECIRRIITETGTPIETEVDTREISPEETEGESFSQHKHHSTWKGRTWKIDQLVQERIVSLERHVDTKFEALDAKLEAITNLMSTMSAHNGTQSKT